ncbi:MAG: HemK2/MTQ2 family protein methyltransferase [Candidatus Woesearchaeota archaeon]
MADPYPVYEVDEDTLLLADVLSKELNARLEKLPCAKRLSFLDMGAGSGYLGFEAFKKKGVSVTLADNNPQAISYMKLLVEDEDFNITVLESDLFEHIPSQEFDVIAFNTPYLPYDTEDDVFDPSVHGGVNGNEVTLRFLDQAKSYLAPGGCILLLFSSLSSPETIVDHMDGLGFSYSIKARKKLFFETLYVYRLWIET